MSRSLLLPLITMASCAGTQPPLSPVSSTPTARTPSRSPPVAVWSRTFRASTAAARPLAASAAPLRPAAPLSLASPHWTLTGSAAWSPTGTLVGKTCCKDWLGASHPLDLPAGGTIAVTVRAPCGAAVAIGLRAAATDPDIAWSRGPRDAAPFAGTLSLVVPPSSDDRTLQINITGGLRCCGDIAIDAVAVTAAAP